MAPPLVIEPSLSDALATFIALWPSTDEPVDLPAATPSSEIAALLLAYGPGGFSARPRGRFVVRDVVVARAGDWAEATVLLHDSRDSAAHAYPYIAKFIEKPGRGWVLMALDALCPSCGGSGLIDQNSRICDTCAGTGWGTSRMDIVAEQPAAARTAATVR